MCSCDVLRELASFAQFKKCEKHPWRSATFSKVAGLKPATLLKVKFLHGCFLGFLNCINGTKSRSASHNHRLAIDLTLNFYIKRTSIFHRLWKANIAWKVSVFGVILVRISPHSDWIRRDTDNGVRQRFNVGDSTSIWLSQLMKYQWVLRVGFRCRFDLELT